MLKQGLIDLINQGNQTFIEGKEADYFEKTAQGQSPEIFVIQCADSRVSFEQLSGITALGSVFKSANIANQVDPSAKASLAYATNVLGVKFIIVLGHTGCGGIMAGLKEAEGNTLDPALQAVSRHIEPIVDLAKQHKETLQGNEQERADALSEINVKEGVKHIERILNEMDLKDPPTVLGGVYDLRKGEFRETS